MNDPISNLYAAFKAELDAVVMALEPEMTIIIPAERSANEPSYEELFLERIRLMQAWPAFRFADPIGAVIASMPKLDIDDAMLRYCRGDAELVRHMHLMDLIPGLEAHIPAMQTYTIANLPDALQPISDPFGIEASSTEARPGRRPGERLAGRRGGRPGSASLH